MKPILKDERILLRALEPTDLDDLYLWENETKLWDVGNTITPYSRAQLWEYLKNYDGDIYNSHQLRLMIESRENGENIGTIDFYDFDPFNNRAAVGLLIIDKYQRQGFGKRALNLTVEYAIKYLGLHQVVAIVPTENTASKKLFESEGFKSSGTLKDWLKIGGEYFDVDFMQLVIS